MVQISLVAAFLTRLLLVLLFFPFSAMDKIFDFKGAVAQASEMTPVRLLAVALICAGVFVEVVMSLAVLTGLADRAAALVLALYCAVTALLWKQFWKPGDFWAGPDAKGRQLFWDFLKNFALAGGFLVIVFGTSARSVPSFFAHPFTSSRPYQIQGARAP